MEKKINAYDFMQNTLLKYLPMVFSNSRLLKKHFMFMRSYPDYEWFNILSILMNNEDTQRVMTHSEWKRLYKKDIYIKKGTKGCFLLIPSYSLENGIKWEIRKGFDYSQIDVKERIPYTSPLKNVIDRIDVDVLRRLNGDEWNDLFIADIISNNEFCIQHPELCLFVSEAIICATGEYLDYDDETIHNINFVWNIDDIHMMVECYRNVKKIIQNIPDYLQDAVLKGSERELDILEWESFNKIRKYGIEDRKRICTRIYYDRLRQGRKRKGKTSIMDEFKEYMEEESIPPYRIGMGYIERSDK